MAQHDHRRLGQPQLRRGEHPAMARDQLAVLGHETGHGPAELGHAGGKLCDLVRAVLLGVAGIGLQTRKRPLLNPLGGEGEGHAGFPGSEWHLGPTAPGFTLPGERQGTRIVERMALPAVEQ